MYQDRMFLIRNLEKLLNKDILFIANNLKQYSSLDYSMIDVVRRIRFSKPRHKDLGIILQTFGGDPNTSYFIMEMLREYYDNISIYIIGDCYSAGTIMAFQADEIFMGPQACLGPIDGQLMTNGDKNSTYWLPSLQSNVNTLIEAEKQEKITPFLQKTFGKRMDILAMYFRMQNSDTDLFRAAFDNHCEESKREETWKYLLGEIGWHSIPLTYKKAISKGINVKRIPDQLIVPITKIVRDAEKDFGELTVTSPLKDLIVNLEEALMDDSDKKDKKDESTKTDKKDDILSKNGKKTDTSYGVSCKHVKIQALIENSYVGFIGYDIYSVSSSIVKGKRTFNLVWLESGWREDNTVSAMVEAEKVEKYTFVIDSIVYETLAKLGRTWDEVSEEEHQEIKLAAEMQLADDLKVEYNARGDSFELLPSSEKKLAIIEAAVEMYEAYKLKDEVHNIVLTMAEEELGEGAPKEEIESLALEIWNELNGEFYASIEDIWEEYEKMEVYDQVKMFKEFILAKDMEE